uniref:Methuselah N-terminal domain-containing protein n=1 Tax=Anopheles atroparvus TaxID=41427 RepID=A0A182IRQ4_ANOAO
MRPPAGYRRRWLLSLLVLLLSITDGSLGTIDNATGVVRENSLPITTEALSSVDPTNIAESDQLTTGETTTTIATSTAASTASETPTSTTERAVSSTRPPASTTTTTNAPVLSTNVQTTMGTFVPIEESAAGDDDGGMPSNCSEFRPSSIQLMYSEKARIRKCCPPGQMIRPRSDFQYECVPGNQELKIETVEAHFYGNNECIEVSDEKVELPVEEQDQCRDVEDALMYSADQGDTMFVLQNGSLLVLEYGSLVSVFDSYCVEMTNDAQLLAKVCEGGRREIWPKWVIISCVTIASVMLLFTALCYSFVPKLNTTFGYLIAGHAGTFAIGTIFLGLARCGDRCISTGSIGVTEMFANAWLGSSVFIFFLMNVFNTMYVAYYIPNGLEYDSKNKREMYAFLAVLYSITLIPLFLMPKGALICMVFIYFGAIALTHALSFYYTGRLTAGNYQSIIDTAGGQTKIDQERLDHINKQKKLCLMETIFSFMWWIIFAVLTLNFSRSGLTQVATVFSVAVQGMFIGVVFVGGRQLWTIIRECWSNSGSLNLREAENGTEMKTIQQKMLPQGNGETHQ